MKTHTDKNSAGVNQGHGFQFSVPSAESEWVNYLDLRCNFSPGHRHPTRYKAIRKALELGVPAEVVVAELILRCGYVGLPEAFKVQSDVEKLYGRGGAAGEGGPGGPGGALPRVTAVTVDVELQGRITAGSPLTVADLVKASPVRFEQPPDGDFTVHTAAILAQLYPDDPWLCLARPAERAGHGVGPVVRLSCYVQRLSWWTLGHRLLGQVFIVPQEQISQRALTAEGKWSYHTKSNCKGWKFVVCEFDGELDEAGRLKEGELDKQATFLLHLKSLGGLLVLVVWSGRRGLQGWFFTEDWSDEKREKFATYCLRLGACSGSIRNISQLCRLPFGLRPKEEGMAAAVRQNVSFFDQAQMGAHL